MVGNDNIILFFPKEVDRNPLVDSVICNGCESVGVISSWRLGPEKWTAYKGRDNAVIILLD